MNGRRSKTKMIAVTAVIVYAAVLPLCMYFIYYLPKAQPPPDLPSLTSGEKAYAAQYDVSPLQYGFDAEKFTAGGFALDYAAAYTYCDDGAFHKLVLVFTDEATYYITLEVFAAGAKYPAHDKYERMVVGGKPVGIFEPQSGDLDVCSARYFDAETGRTYFLEPLAGFTDTEFRFLEILVAL